MLVSPVAVAGKNMYQKLARGEMYQSNFIQMMNMCLEGEISIRRVDKDIGII